MGTEERVARVQEMEQALDQATAALAVFEKNLDEFEAIQPVVARLAAYYGSEDWFEDREADEAGELPADLKRGILGEDLPYDLLVSYRELAIRMLEDATQALKE